MNIGDEVKRYTDSLDDFELNEHLKLCKFSYYFFKGLIDDDQSRELWSPKSTKDDVSIRAEWFRQAYWQIIKRMKQLG